MEFSHISVLLNETIENLNIKPNGIYVDGTLGGAGHSSEILKRLNDDGLLIGIDKDKAAIEHSQNKLKEFGNKFKLVNNDYEHFDNVLDNLNIDLVDGILIDIGVSSYQFDEGSRGFSYNFDSRLDMRMDQDSNFSAWDIVNEYSEEELKDIFYKYGEENWAARIAKFIIEERKIKSIDTTFELTEIIKKAIPKSARRDTGHPSRKVFQALRIETNDELGILERTLERMVYRLKVGGRLAVITFHSLEDRIVKEKFKFLNLSCICPPEIPKCVCNKKKEIEYVNKKPIIASEKELSINNRARSAKLRVVERV